MKVTIDFETRSVCDLKVQGAHLYSLHPTTEVLCMAYAFDDGPVNLWTPDKPFPRELRQAIAKGSELEAHNASFEHLIWNNCAVKKYKFPPVSIRQFDCSMIRAYALGLPGMLEKAAIAMGLKYQKDMKGHRIMLQLCKPRQGPEESCSFCQGRGYTKKLKTCECVVWWEITDPARGNVASGLEKFNKLYQYCISDVLVERLLSKRLPKLLPDEKELWYLDQEINNRGVYIDVKAIKAALAIIKVEKKRLNEKMRKLTNREVSSCDAAVALAKWLNKHGIKTKDDEEFIVESVDKASVLDLLEMKIPTKVKSALLLRQEAAKNSTAKLNMMLKSVGPDGRIRGCFQFHGAASTGRWAGRRIQLQNLTRPTISQEKIEEIFKILTDDSLGINQKIEKISFFYGSPIARVADCLRGMIRAAPGKKLIAIDFSQIESRVLAWLAGEEAKLNVFRGHGLFYEYAATKIYGVALKEVTQQQRLVGKVSELSLGFGGGVGAFQSMAKNYFVKVPDKEADKIKVSWRGGNQRIVAYWYDCENAAMAATKNPGQKFAVGPRGRQVIFLRSGSFLFCRLPSGRAICYPYPEIKLFKMVKDPETGRFRQYDPVEDKGKRLEIIEKLGLSYKGEDSYTKKFIKKSGYGGLLCENITQATARDLLVFGMKNSEKRKCPIVIHVHDEIVAEVDEDFDDLKGSEESMRRIPEWAKDLPMAVAGWEGLRYRK